MDERDAIQRCLEGSTEAFSEIVQFYQAQILGLCLRMTGSREDAADVAQQAFVNCYRHLDRYDPHQPFRPWLYRIATNECIAFLRRRGRAVTVADEEAVGGAADSGAGAPALVELAEDRERVRDAVARLPSQYRTVVVLYYFRELSYQEIARQTGLPVGTISTHLHRAKNLLKQLLGEQEVGAVEPHRSGTAATVPGR